MTLADCLATQSAALDAYIRLLDEEALALREGRYPQLPALVERKAHLAQRLAQVDRLRQQLETLEPTGADHAAQPPCLEQARARLRERAGAARAANQRNGVIVHTLLAFTREALGLLHAGSRPLYGPQGAHLQGPPTGRYLGRG